MAGEGTKQNEGRQNEGMMGNKMMGTRAHSQRLGSKPLYPLLCFQKLNPRAFCCWGCRDGGRGYDGIRNDEK